MNKLTQISTAALMALTVLGVAAAPASAATCRDAHGRFTQCSSSAAYTAAKGKTKMHTAHHAKPAHKAKGKHAKLSAVTTKHATTPVKGETAPTKPSA